MSQKGDRQDRESTKDDALLLRLGRHVAIGLEFPSTVIGGMVVGYLLDLYFDTSPWLAISITSLAFLGACIRLVQWVRHFQDDGN